MFSDYSRVLGRVQTFSHDPAFFQELNMKTLPPVALKVHGPGAQALPAATPSLVIIFLILRWQKCSLRHNGSKGLDLWDTAAVYGMGSSETALGALVRQFPREHIILSTKFTPQIADKQSAQPVSDMLEASLGRLGVDAIDTPTGSIIPSTSKNGHQPLIPLLQSGKGKTRRCFQPQSGTNQTRQ